MDAEPPSTRELANILRLLKDRDDLLARAAALDQLALIVRGRLDPCTRRTLDRLILIDSRRLDRGWARAARKALSPN